MSERAPEQHADDLEPSQAVACLGPTAGPAPSEPVAGPDAASRPAPSEPVVSPDPASRHENGVVRVAVVRFRTPGQPTELSAGDLQLVPSSLVVAESDRGTRIGTVVALRDGAAVAPQHRVLRVVTDEDLEVHNRNKVREREAFAFCLERIHALGLAMKLVGVEISHSGSSAAFSFTSTDRIDFRALVRDLARRFHLRIDMRQIGVRDASRVCGAVGVCGRALCCATFLPSFSPISVRMAKDQNLALNQDKLSGACGRLKCCLAFEEDAYAALRKGLPKVGKRVITPEGEARVKDVNVIKRLVRVQLVDGRYREFRGDEVKRPIDLAASAAVEEVDDAPTGVVEPSTAAPPAGAAVPAAAPAGAAVPATGPGQEGSRKRRRRRRRHSHAPDAAGASAGQPSAGGGAAAIAERPSAARIETPTRARGPGPEPDGIPPRGPGREGQAR